ncbi:response regulator [Euryarchaeota archaeon]|nr:response regulator [Euryarchaeota archaeon]MDA8690449.1 response regulator [Euryarchaeota archaeon]MDA9156167.1 response regulator [Candidatus Poseidoniaceae archaeon]
MAKVIVADENEGRRSLLANTLERNGFDITRAATLRQAEGTALAIMPEVVLIDGEWKSGDAIDACQRLMSDPEFAFKCRVVILGRNVSQEYLMSAAQSGVSEVIRKPVDMNVLIQQLNKHTRKQFVPPPADVERASGGGGSFDVSMTMGDSSWALPMLKGLVGPENINTNFIDEILTQMDEEGMEVSTELDSSAMSSMLRMALNKLVEQASVDGELDAPNAAGQNPMMGPSSPSQAKKGTSLGGNQLQQMNQGFSSSMEGILESQAQDLADEVESKMDAILDEEPELIALHDFGTMVPIDPEVLKLTRLTSEVVSDLMWNLGQRGVVSDITLLTQIEDAAQMMADVLDALPHVEEEE